MKLTMASTIAPRPGPPNEQTSARVLHPIYQALDTHNYTKTLKLTSAAPQNEWDIVRALRVHALGRSGKRREALVLLWEVIVKNVVLPGSADDGIVKGPEDVWSELYEKIASISDANDLVNDASNNTGLKIQQLDAVQRLDTYAFAPVVKASSTAEIAPKAPAKAPADSSGKSTSAKSKGKVSKSKGGNTSKGKATSKNIFFPPVTDETVLNTLAVTLRIEGMLDTLSEMFFQAMECGTDEHVLEEAVCVHFQASCDCIELKITGDEIKATDEDVMWKLQSHLPKLQTLLNLTKYYERMQSSSLQLAKISSESLHFQWTAVSSLWYSEGLQQLVTILETFHSVLGSMDDSNEEVKRIRESVTNMVGIQEVDELFFKCQKMKQKLALLPRLAESLSTRMVSNPGGNVSENDWDVYLETLLVQGKKDEALKVLETVECTPMLMDGADKSLTGVLPLIDDENTIETHVGSILPYTQRKKLERIASLSLEMSRHEQAEVCYRELLGCFPDQWTYWLGLVDACIAGEQDFEEGWNKCRSYAEEVIAKDTQKHSLRGPHLFLVQLASLNVKRTNVTGEEMKQTLASLREAICNYGEKFAPLASCCFADIRPYLCTLSKTSRSEEFDNPIPNDVKFLLEWAKAMWRDNAQAADDSSQSEVELSHDEVRNRRAKLRAFIFAIQFVYSLAVEFEVSTLQLLEEYAPENNQIALEWRSSLTYLPGVAPKDGGQKEVLPGDELVLLLTQKLQKTASTEVSDSLATPLLEAAALLEEAMDYSPYNPHLKIAAVGVYLQLGASHRALSIYQGMGVKQIQIDSCSYLILPSLVNGGLYTSAARLSSSILRLHSSTSKDIKDFASKALQNGNLFKAREMSTFQRVKMRPSSQLLYSKGVVMDCASLLNPNDLEEISSDEQISSVKLGTEKGLCGNVDDITRSEQIAADSSSFFNAPFIIHEAANAASVDACVYSDNRDMDINYFEILHRRQHLTQSEMFTNSIHKGHTQGLLVRAVMAVEAAKAPKKGKVPKATEEIVYRCRSLTRALARARHFLQGSDDADSIDRSLFQVFSSLCDVIGVVILGDAGEESDTLVNRENAAVRLLEAAILHVKKAQAMVNSSEDSRGALVCKLLPTCIVPIYTMIETTARLFSLFGWGKRKRLTKAAAGALANLTVSCRSLISDLLEAMKNYRCFEYDVSHETLLVGEDGIKRVVHEVTQSRKMTRDRVDPYFDQMMIDLTSYEADD